MYLHKTHCKEKLINVLTKNFGNKLREHVLIRLHEIDMLFIFICFLISAIPIFTTSRLCRRRPAETFHQQYPGLVFWFNQQSRVYFGSSGSCVSSSEKSMNFVHFHNPHTKLRSSYSRNHDWQSSQRILPQFIVNYLRGSRDCT